PRLSNRRRGGRNGDARPADAGRAGRGRPPHGAEGRSRDAGRSLRRRDDGRPDRGAAGRGRLVDLTAQTTKRPPSSGRRFSPYSLRRSLHLAEDAAETDQAHAIAAAPAWRTTLMAWSPFGPSLISNSTVSSSKRRRRPSPEICE